MIATGKMIAWCALFAALAPFDSGELFQFSMPLFDEPTHLVLVLNHRRVNRTWGAIRDHPFPVAVRGDHLEKLHFKRNFLEFDGDATLKVFGGPFELLPVNVAWFWTQADAAIFFQRRHQELVKPMNELEIFRCGIPAVEPDRLRLNAFFFKGLAKQVPEVVVFCFPVGVRGIPAKIQWIVIPLMGMNQINNPDSFD